MLNSEKYQNGKNRYLSDIQRKVYSECVMAVEKWSLPFTVFICDWWMYPFMEDDWT